MHDNGAQDNQSYRISPLHCQKKDLTLLDAPDVCTPAGE
jgi:hypothetical protein